MNIIGTPNIMKNINSTWIELQKDKLKLAELKTYIDEETNKIKESAI